MRSPRLDFLAWWNRSRCDRSTRHRATSLMLVALGLISFPLQAHQTSDSYLSLTLTNNHLEARWAIAIRDLNHVLEIDTDKDGEISDSELEKAKPNIENYAYNRLKLTTDSKPFTLQHQSYQIQETDTAVYLVLLAASETRETWPDLLIEFNLFFDTDPLHRGLLKLDLPNRTETTIFNPANPANRFILGTTIPPQTSNTFQRFLKEGIWHIWIGYDHILFLIALLLPSVLLYGVPASAGSPSRNRADGSPLRAILTNILKIVTAFTIAHSITLTLATLDYVQLPSRLIESIIAASVLLAAVNNVKPILPNRPWTIAFTFGLIHGFGFANVLGELDLPRAQLGLTLLAFNLGVELGQLAIVLAFIPLAYPLRQTNFYKKIILRFGSLTIALLAGIWLLERTTDKKLLPF